MLHANDYFILYINLVTCGPVIPEIMKAELEYRVIPVQSCTNLVNFGPLTPEFMRLYCIQFNCVRYGSALLGISDVHVTCVAEQNK